MKPFKILLLFLGLFTFIFILDCIGHSDLLKQGETNIKQLFSSIHQGLNLALMFTFISSFRELKKIESLQKFKTYRKSLIIYIFLFTWISNVALMVTEHWILKHEIYWIKGILFSLLWAVISMLLSLLFSGAFMQRKPINQTGDN